MSENTAAIDQLREEVVEMLREIWKQMVAVDQTLRREIQAVTENLGTRIDAVKGGVAEVRDGLAELKTEVIELKTEVVANRTATHDGFQLLARTGARRDREIEELRERLDRVEGHVGLSPR